MKETNNGITFEDVERIASGMLAKAVKPTVRAVISVSGGKTEVVSKHLRDFFEKRDTEVSKMADEIGSSSVAKLIAGEIHVIVEKRTSELSEINIRQKEQIDEYVELLEEKVIESDTIKKDLFESVEVIKKEAAEKIEKITLDASNKIKKSESEIETANEAKRQAETESSEIKLISENSIKASKEQANALIEVANTRASQAEQETKLLREQVKSLSIDEAKRDIEKAELEKTKQLFEALRFDLAEQKTEAVRHTVENEALTKDINRLETDNREYKQLDKELTKSQTQLVESQKMITDLNSKLSLSERERESLTTALSKK
ncbi:MAG: hypothetical protein COB67_00400 [SAR324 cluster bacterium]|uniref:KfrA N-terminal DNA-binding domain-containing protein n=1 Tax=SAR324 cluster bacterium TaxID=2024889 RepID=A0A2A4TCB2_9DELT|nr:MAG: hypothetical protein COB67_00400 [SAR324 cluster bacterium]